MEALNIYLLKFFDWLLWTTIQGSVLIVLIALVQKLLRHRLPVHWHYLLWFLLILRLASPWLPESKISIFNLVPRSVQQGKLIESYTQSRDNRGMGFYMHARSASASQTTEEAEAFSVKIVRKLPVFWLAGTVLIAIYVCVRSIRLWRMVKCERPITDSEILDLLEDCKMQMRVETIVAVVVSDRIKSPALFGFVRPRLLLPQGMLETYGLEELRYVFIHELAHLKQRDIYLGWLMALLHVAHWFNPLMWFAFSRIRADREIACDRLAISTMEPDEPHEYGRTILSLLESFSQTRYLPSVAGILEDKCQLERRINMIANPDKKSRSQSILATFLLVALGCVTLTDAYSAVDSMDQKVPASLQRNVLMYFSFDRDGGTRAIDISGMDFHGKLHGCEYVKEGRLGGAMQFDGDDDYISISDVKLRAFSFSAWVKTNTASLNNRRLFLLDGGQEYYAVQGTSRGDVELSGADFGDDDPEPILMHKFAVNEWTYVTTTFDGDAFRVYMNGVPTRSGHGLHEGLIGTVYLGGTDKYRGCYWHGSMDEVAVFNRALTEDEAKQLYTMTGGSSTKDMQGPAQFEGVWSGLAVDKPEYGTSSDGLTLELSVDESGRLAGIALGEFVDSQNCRIKNVKVTGNRIYFEVRHRFRNMRMGITLELTDGVLQGEGIPIDVDDDQCEIKLHKQSSITSRSGIRKPTPDIAPDNAQGADRFTGVWRGMAVDKPEDGGSRNSLTVILKADDYGHLTGEAMGSFVKDDYCKLENLKVSGSNISFVLAHRIENLRVSVTLELSNGKLQGEGLPINSDEDRCDIMLERE